MWAWETSFEPDSYLSVHYRKDVRNAKGKEPFCYTLIMFLKKNSGKCMPRRVTSVNSGFDLDYAPPQQFH